MEAHLVEYNVTDAAIAKMETEYMALAINGIDDKDGFKAVHAARMVVKGKRVEVEKRRKELKKDALEYGRKVDTEAKRIFGMLAPIEEHLQAEEDAVIQERERIKAEEARKEQERIDGIRAKITAIVKMATVTGFSAEKIQERIDEIGAIDVTQEEYQEFFEEAMSTGTAVLEELVKALEAQKAVEKADAERKAEAERLEKIRKEQEEEAERLRKIQEEQERKAKETEEALAQERRRQEAEREEAQKELDRLAEELAENNRKLQAERVAIEAEKAAREKAEREEAERIAKEKAEAEEKARQEALRPDKEKLLAWLGLFNNNNLTKPILKSKEAQNVLDDAMRRLGQLLKNVRQNVEAL